VIEVNLVSFIPILAFVSLLLLQSISPRRDLAKTGLKRTTHNLFLFLSNTLIMRVLVPLSLIKIATWTSTSNLGLFNLVEAPIFLSVFFSILLLDFAVYWQHVATHKFSILWRMHKVHHADTNMDVTTAIRFHPIELVLSLIYKSAIVILLGAPIVSVIIFEHQMFIAHIIRRLLLSKIPIMVFSLFGGINCLVHILSRLSMVMRK